MREINSILILSSIKNSNMFTKNQSFKKYLTGLKFRIEQYYGVSTKNWGPTQTYKFLLKKSELENKHENK